MKSRSKNIFMALLTLPMALTMLGVARPGAGGPAVDADSYPSIGKEEMGQLIWTLRIADQELDDFSNLEALDQAGMTAYRYGIAFHTYFLATEQYHKLPACSSIIGPRMDRLIRRMVRKPVWEYWAETSKGIYYLEPRMNKPWPANHDPVSFQNIMYSGHLGQMIGLYETLYRDLKWDRAGSIVFEWSADEKYVYDNYSLQKVMYDQMAAPPHCIPCEPNACFPECNQHPVLSFMLYDLLHGTHLADVREQFMEFFLAKKMIDPKNHETAALYLIKQDLTLRQRDPRFGNAYDLLLVPAVATGALKIYSSSANGWTGTMMHAWQPEYIEQQYPYQLKHHLVEMKDDEARLKKDSFEPRLQYGFFAMLAGEVGDRDTRDKLITYADAKYGPAWKDGAFVYPFDKAKQCTGLSGVLLAIARANPEDGFWKLHNRPFDDAHFQEPAVESVDFPNVLLSRAIYDRDQQALVITTLPGAQKGGKTSLGIGRLTPAKSYAVFVDSERKETVSQKSGIEVEVPLDGEHDVIVQAM
ncbi:MAG TPA: hypothetical protein VM658_19380 [bacterium]|nr:hypothetical protein [bacterium]